MTEDDVWPNAKPLIGFGVQQFNLGPSLTAWRTSIFPSLLGRTASHSRRTRDAAPRGSRSFGDRVEQSPGRCCPLASTRVAVARALVTEPSPDLADDPTANLDSPHRRRGAPAPPRSPTPPGRTIVLITHDHDSLAPAGLIVNFLYGAVAGYTAG